MRKYRIINRKRFFAALVMLMSVIALSINAVSSEHYKTNYATCEFTVHEGDTLWEIAELYADESIDVRKYIKLIQEYNNLETSELAPGDVLVIPYEHKKREATFHRNFSK